MKKIPLTQGKFAIVDDCDFKRLSRFKWFAVRTDRGQWYAARKDRKLNVQMQKDILDVPDGFMSDHKNLNGLDNRRRNLRPATRSQNASNSKVRSDSRSGFKGVRRVSGIKITGKNPWLAQIRALGRCLHLGCFLSPETAALAYDKAARKYFGEFARTNF